jgi:hypothetical protein
MPAFVLTDVARDLWVDHLSITPANVPLDVNHAWSVHKQTLRGGRRDGVDVILVNNGALSFSVVPTRGMGIWNGQFKGVRVGWDSPVRDGPVHPSFVNLMNAGGIGWLEGFDELLVRCGLEHNGPPYQEAATVFPLHGRIANIPAHYVSVHVTESAPHEIRVEGKVDEARLFGPRIRMSSTIVTALGSNRLVVRDEFTNLGDLPAELQILYHWNFGPPLLEEGARLVAPVKSVVPRDARAAEGIGHYDTFGQPQPGTTEQVYYFELHATGPQKQTVAMLMNRPRDKAALLRFSHGQLPAFTLWKNTAGRKDGYVTGLEPATNYPNPKPFERERKRVVALAPGATHVAETALEIFDTRDAVAAIEAEIHTLQKQGSPTVHKQPVEPYAKEWREVSPPSAPSSQSRWRK